MHFVGYKIISIKQPKNLKFKKFNKYILLKVYKSPKIKLYFNVLLFYATISKSKE